MGPYPGALPPAPAPSIWTRGHAISARVVTVLAICWFLVEAWFAFASSTMFEKYQFAALASPARDIYRVSSFCIVCIALCGIGSTTTANTKVMKLLVGVLVVGNVSAYIATRSRTSHELWFADAFNDFFCTTRTLQVCIEGDDLQLLELTRGEASGNANVTSNGNAVFIWRRCRDVLVESNTELVETSWGAFQPSDLGLVSDAHRAFLADCTVTDANDSWCGNQYLATHTKTPATAAANSGEGVNHPGSISPFDANPRMFARFVSEWKTRMMYDNVLLGSILAFLLIQAVCERRLHLALGFQMIPQRLIAATITTTRPRCTTTSQAVQRFFLNETTNAAATQARLFSVNEITLSQRYRLQSNTNTTAHWKPNPTPTPTPTPSPLQTPTPTPTSSQLLLFDMQMLDAVGAERAAYGHTESDNSTAAQRVFVQGLQYSSMGENITTGQTTITRIVGSWMNSAGHRANIFGNYKFFGVGYMYNSSSSYGHYWT